MRTSSASASWPGSGSPPRSHPTRRRSSSEPAFQHHFLGLCSLADWIGSNEDWFPLREDPEDDYMEEARRRARGAVGAIGLDLSRQRSQLAGAPGFDALFPHIGLSPNAIQRAAAQATPLPEPLVIVESETGSGKTEAALWPFRPDVRG